MLLGAPNQNTGILGKLRELVVMIHRLTRGVGLKMLIVRYSLSCVYSCRELMES